jgi:predicted histone-like DNA-binding protein
MKYKLIERANPLNRNQKKWHAGMVLYGRVTKSELAKEIVTVSSLSRGDVSNTIECLVDICPKYLLMNKSVSLGDLGTLRISFSSEGVENPEDFKVSMISAPRVIFTPSAELKKQLANITFERVD